jgi:hypothetical protein
MLALKTFQNAVLIFCFLLLSACSLQYHYSKALNSAAQPSAAKIATNLTKIAAAEPNLQWKKINGEDYVLVSSWKADTKYYKNDQTTGLYNTGKYPIWVTVAPDLQRWSAAQKKLPQVEKRLKQLLGLPPDADKKYFVEFWVRPQDLFRPCIDMEVTDSACELYLKNRAEANCENLLWLAEQVRMSFADSVLYKRYPFTQLGYTYDWNPHNKQHMGLSEFVIGPNKKIVVGEVFATADYLKKK